MNARIPILVISFGLAIASLLAGCSKKEEAPPASTGSAVEERESSNTSAGSEVEELGSGDAVALAETFANECSGAAASTQDCQILRSLLVVEVTLALEEIERSRDQRGTEEALAALDLTDEPEILIAACRILGQFPDTPGIAEKAVPLILSSPYIQVQQAAANLIGRNSDRSIADIGDMWARNHSSLGAQNEYEEYPDFPKHYATMKFPDYPDAEWFSPADSDRSIGWSTPEASAAVAKQIAGYLKTEPMSYLQWYESQNERMRRAVKIDPAKTERIEALTQKYVQTLDVALMEEIQKLQKEAYAPMEAATAIMQKGMDEVAIAPSSAPQGDVHFFVAEEKDGHISRAVLVYPMPYLNRTVVQMSWNLTDYPSAWPES